MVFTTVNRGGPIIGMEGVWTSGNVTTISQVQPAGNYNASSVGTSTGTSTTGASGSTTTTPTSGTSTTTGGSTTVTYTPRHTKPITPPTPQPSPSYGTSGTRAEPTSMGSPQTVVSQPSATMPQEAPETATTTPTGEAHLWIGWKVEPWEEEVIKKFVEAFSHGMHIHRPIELPPMGGVLAPIPGAPAPGAPVAIMQPQEASNQNQYQLGE